MRLIIVAHIVSFIWLSLIVPAAKAVQNQESIDLAGTWSCRLDPNENGEKQKWFTQEFETSVKLPGSLDENGLGAEVSLKPELTTDVLKHLTRKFKYIGSAWYQKQIDIPEQWNNKRIFLTLERVLWESRLWVDDKEIGMQDSVLSPHIYDISQAGPGKHTITIRVDNSYKYRIGAVRSHKEPLGHSYTEETQTIWNGVIGDMKIAAYDKLHIEDVQVYPDVDKKIVNLNIKLRNDTEKSAKGKLIVTVNGVGYDAKLSPVTIPFSTENDVQVITADYPMGDDFKLWSEFTPNIYELKVDLDCGDFADTQKVNFGMRKLTSENGSFIMNGNRIFLRGTVECCVFPLTGYPAMDTAYWEKIFKTCQSYGLNHVRFHSWCPPEAAFAVADSMGFYLQVELPIWVFDFGKDPARESFVRAEAERIISTYGNHPSFCMMSMGNELGGDFKPIEELVTHLRNLDTRHLYTATTYSFEKGYGEWPDKVDDFFVSQRTRNGWIRGQGFFNSRQPSTTLNFNSSLEGIDVPTVAHEIGQYAVFPNINEIEKYTGVLKPVNFEAVKKVLGEKHLFAQADSFTLASGKLAVILYKEDVELGLRSDMLDGFQLLSLTDFPGQGTALTGILDIFWDSKGIISPEQFRQFCSTTVPLLETPKFVYQNSESFTGKVMISHFGPKAIDDAQLKWIINDEQGKTIAQGDFKIQTIKSGGNSELGEINAPLDVVDKACKLRVEIFATDSNIRNGWDIWVYPANSEIVKSPNLLITNVFDANAHKWLDEGRNVLLTPERAAIKKAVSARFVPVFWSPVHFPDQPGTMGVLCDPNHSALSDFTTDYHTNWQWWELTSESTAIDVDSLGPRFKPIVQPVCNFLQIKKLAYIFEAKVGKGKLLVCSLDIDKDLDKRLVARQLRRSLISYMAGDKFQPAHVLPLSAIEDLFAAQ
ncbi:MAG: hypothetical protein A2Y10_01000 [Planctomycetes bacterium GWF2_41_51]|nr:MAG: hypothetical protein A2Y10_01000 [Planctomycetes bacterium GWF2_41_51]HBG26523.1 glycoside hydrolase family 2 [Phycisphaerales bacterium]